MDPRQPLQRPGEGRSHASLDTRPAPLDVPGRITVASSAYQAANLPASSSAHAPDISSKTARTHQQPARRPPCRQRLTTHWINWTIE